MVLMNSPYWNNPWSSVSCRKKNNTNRVVPILDASIHIVPVLIGGTMKQLIPPDTLKF